MDYLLKTSDRQKVLIAFAIIVVVMFLFPPFTIKATDDYERAFTFAEYGFIGAPPKTPVEEIELADGWVIVTFVSINIGLLLAQLLGAVAASAGAWLFFGENHRRRASSTESESSDSGVERYSRQEGRVRRGSL